MSNKAAKDGLVPNRRFPEFREAGAWEEVPLSELINSLDAGVSVNSGDRPATESQIGVLKTSAVTNGIFEPQENKVVFDEVETGRVKEPVQGDTIIISRMNTPALVGANAYVKKSLKNIFLPDRLWAAKAKAGTSMRFVAFILGSEKGRAALSKLAKGSSGSMKNITKPDVLAFLVLAPTPSEQQKIADCLASLDELITLESQKLATLKTHKKGLMQQLFPAEGETLPKLRFPEFRDAGEWDIRVFREVVARSFYGTSSSTSAYGTYPVLRMGNMADGGLDISNLVFIDLSAAEFNKFELKRGDIVLNRTNSIDLVGKISLFDLDGKYIAASYLVVFRLKTVLIASDFCNYLLNSDSYQSRIKEFATRAVSQANINPTTFQEKLTVALPSLPEQQTIADCLASLDDLITAQTQKLATLKTHKKGLMQQLFPALDQAAA